nr:MAG TPA: hypothetical protein [Caudoviricetes sp.]
MTTARRVKTGQNRGPNTAAVLSEGLTLPLACARGPILGYQ